MTLSDDRLRDMLARGWGATREEFREIAPELLAARDGLEGLRRVREQAQSTVDSLDEEAHRALCSSDKDKLDVRDRAAGRAAYVKRVIGYIDAELAKAPAPSPSRECDQCGEKDWPEWQDSRCPNHANPHGSCDGKLVPIAPTAAADAGEDAEEIEVWRKRAISLFVPGITSNASPATVSNFGHIEDGTSIMRRLTADRDRAIAERGALRNALIACGKSVDAMLTDRVTTGFLVGPPGVPGEVEAVMSRMRSRLTEAIAERDAANKQLNEAKCDLAIANREMDRCGPLTTYLSETKGPDGESALMHGTSAPEVALIWIKRLFAQVEQLREDYRREQNAKESLKSDLEAVTQERDKYRFSASQFCGAHIGQKFDRCPVCYGKDIRKERDELAASLATAERANAGAAIEELRSLVDYIHSIDAGSPYPLTMTESAIKRRIAALESQDAPQPGAQGGQGDAETAQPEMARQERYVIEAAQETMRKYRVGSDAWLDAVGELLSLLAKRELSRRAAP